MLIAPPFEQLAWSVSIPGTYGSKIHSNRSHVPFPKQRPGHDEAVPHILYIRIEEGSDYAQSLPKNDLKFLEYIQSLALYQAVVRYSIRVDERFVRTVQFLGTRVRTLVFNVVPELDQSFAPAGDRNRQCNDPRTVASSFVVDFLVAAAARMKRDVVLSLAGIVTIFSNTIQVAWAPNGGFFFFESIFNCSHEKQTGGH
jgi:hypothetical protein